MQSRNLKSSLLKNMLQRKLPTTVNKVIKCIKILEFDYGHMQTARMSSCIDAKGRPIPWYTYPAIEYIKQLDFSEKVVFEYGSGNSTLFWGKFSRKLISVEDNDWWYEKVSKEARKSKNIEIQLIVDRLSYVQSISQQNEDFDVIVIDGMYRYDCALEAVKKLKSGGIIILDNSDWAVQTSRLLRESKLIQVDMSGFGPINDFVWTTSFFIHRDFNFMPANKNQPELSIGSLDLREMFSKHDMPFKEDI